MGAAGSKSTLQRQNTIRKRNQRKNILHLQGKVQRAAKLILEYQDKDRSKLVELRNELILLERKLKTYEADLHPACNGIYERAGSDIKYWIQVSEGQTRGRAVLQKQISEDVQSDVFSEQSHDVRFNEEEEEQVVQVHEPAMSNRQSEILKMGVPVMPQSIVDKVNRKTGVFDVVQEKYSERIDEIEQSIGDLEVKISEFRGQKGGAEYEEIKKELMCLQGELKLIHANGESEMVDKIQSCMEYVKSCLSFLDEKTINIVVKENNNNNVKLADENMNEISLGYKTTLI